MVIYNPQGCAVRATGLCETVAIGCEHSSVQTLLVCKRTYYLFRKKHHSVGLKNYLIV